MCKPAGGRCAPARQHTAAPRARTQVFMLPSDRPLDESALQDILTSGHSRLPVHQPGNRCVWRRPARWLAGSLCGGGSRAALRAPALLLAWGCQRSAVLRQRQRGASRPRSCSAPAAAVLLLRPGRTTRTAVALRVKPPCRCGCAHNGTHTPYTPHTHTHTHHTHHITQAHAGGAHPGEGACARRP
jgi:hypothetical protein